jgi:hypothetical protein
MSQSEDWKSVRDYMAEEKAAGMAHVERPAILDETRPTEVKAAERFDREVGLAGEAYTFALLRKDKLSESEQLHIAREVRKAIASLA